MKINKNKILMSLLVGGLIVGLVTPNMIKANELEDVKEEEEVVETEEVVESFNSSTEIEDIKFEETTLEDNVEAKTVITYANADAAFPESSKPLHDAILAKYPAIDTNTDGSTGYISKAEAAAFNKEIDVRSSSLTGTIDGIENFTTLKKLWVSNNQLEGQIPASIGSMSALTQLYLNDNQLSGKIPTSIGNVNSLKVLQLQGNKLSGEIPNEFWNLTGLTTLYLYNNQLSGTISDAIGNMTSLDSFLAHTNKLTGAIPSTIGNLTLLKNLQLQNNQLNGQVPSTIGNLTALQHLYLYNNQLSGELPSTIGNLTSLTRFYYHYNNISTGNLAGINSLTRLTVTKATNANLTNVTEFYVSSDKPNDSAIVKLTATAGGAFSWDATTGYYVIASSMGAKYQVGLVYTDANGNLSMIESSTIDLSEGGLMDREGNLILGAKASDIVDGKVNLPNGGTVVTGDATYTFDGNTVVGNTEITTEGSIVIEKNTIDGSTISTDSTTEIKVPNGNDTTISLNDNGGTIGIPSGSIITNGDGSQTYLTGDAVVDLDGNITSNDKTITVPSDKIGSITTDTDGNIVLPEGSVVTDNGTDVTYPGTIVYNPKDNTVKYMPIDDLFDENGVIKDEVTQAEIDNTKSIIDQVAEGNLKEELKDKLEDAQNQLNEKEAEKAVDDLFDEDGKIKDTVTQEDIDNAEDLVNKLPEGNKKEELKDKLKDAQDQLDEKNKKQDAKDAVEDLFKPDGSGNIKDDLTQGEIDNAQNKVDLLPDGDLKTELQKEIDDAQKQLDEKNFVLLKDFEEFTGSGTVSAKVDAPVEKFSKVYVNGKELDTSNYEVTSGSTVITLKESYLQTLLIDSYKVEIVFKSGVRVPATLKVNTAQISQPPVISKPSVDASNTVSGSAVSTGDKTDLTALYAMLAASLLGLVVVIKRGKEQAE